MNTSKTTMTVSFEVEVKDSWIELLTKYADIFRRDHSGYWLFGAERIEGGWLAYEMHDEERPSEADCEAAKAAYARKEPMPEHWFVIDRDFALRAWAEGVKRKGVHWYDDGDAGDYDVAVQRAALGEVRYG